MKEHQCITYFRVSTQKQGISGLGLDAQRSAVAKYLTGSSKTVLAEFVEIETGRVLTPWIVALNCVWHLSFARSMEPPF